MQTGQRDRASGIDAEKTTDADEQLDEKLKQLGDEFLDDEVPDALLDVLRRGMGTKSDPKSRTDDGDAAPPTDQRRED